MSLAVMKDWCLRSDKYDAHVLRKDISIVKWWYVHHGLNRI